MRSVPTGKSEHNDAYLIFSVRLPCEHGPGTYPSQNRYPVARIT